MRDGTHETSSAIAIAPAVYSDNSVPAITVDRLGYDSLTFVLAIGAGGITFTGTNRIDFVLEHSLDATAWDPVDPTNVIGAVPDASGIVLSQRTAHPNATAMRIGYVDGIVGDRRYVRLRLAFNGTHSTGTPISALALLGEARIAPVAA